MLKLLINLLILHFSCSVCFAQSQYKNDFDFLSATIKNAYSGYFDKANGKEFDELVQRVKRSRSKDTFALLSQMTLFFNDHHLALHDLRIGQRKIDTQQCKKDSLLVQKYFANRKLKDQYEGFWLSEFNNCVIALKKVKTNPVIYHGYVVECNAKLMPGYCMLKMTRQKDGTFLTDYIDVDFYFRIFAKSKFKNTNTLWVNSRDRFQRITVYTPGFLTNKKAISYKPYFTSIDDKTVLLAMPSFRRKYITTIDSIVQANKAAIDSATTLIVDIRNNGGGTINNYFPLFPYIYTNPIVHCGGYVRYSDVYIQDYEADIRRFVEQGDTAKAALYTKYLDTIKLKKGQFDYTPPDTLAQDLPILARPKKVAVLINNNCLSAAELMLLNFKQSSKVTIFGERTGGAVDYLDGLRLTLPRHKYDLFIAISKRELTTQQPSYDATGIKPDVEIADDVTDWIEFVRKYYNEHQ